LCIAKRMLKTACNGFGAARLGARITTRGSVLSAARNAFGTVLLLLNIKTFTSVVSGECLLGAAMNASVSRTSRGTGDRAPIDPNRNVP
jgi:hypothetical protein